MSAKGSRWYDVKPCGTPSAYRRHIRRGEKPCKSCRQAEAIRWSGYGPARNQRARIRYAELRAAGMSVTEAERLRWRQAP